MRLSASSSLTHLATHFNRFCLYSVQDGRQSLGMGVKRFVPEVTSLFSTSGGDGLRSHLTWGGGTVEGSGEWSSESEPSPLTRVRLGGLGIVTGLFILSMCDGSTIQVCFVQSDCENLSIAPILIHQAFKFSRQSPWHPEQLLA